ncbi:M20 family metallopeptidase [Ferroplasma acidiphilum]|uniref:M20 family metallopeptidase n=1 Tax=Ferroplasma acidiphilum TaxID=74969 RepID=UPI0028168088|nr:M20 family metallopeptidase [Ferroplasma acidiphilum]WMT53318.1 MAG: M20 family metallopeptidase [Ferroplasma acidiphilum]
MNNVFQYFKSQQDSMLSDLKSLVEMETPSTDKVLLDKFAGYMAGYLKENLGIAPEIIKSESAGNDLRLAIKGKSDNQILLLCHYDTVFPEGTIKSRPFKVENGKGYGPGIFDMKTGLVQTVYALKALVKNKELKYSIVLLITSDEEIESGSSKDLIISEAKKSIFTFVMEPSLDGALKTERSGVGTITLKIYGKASHAGLEPEKGINAIYEMAYMIPVIEKLNDKQKGTSINLDVINGGTRSNVIPDYCEGIMDIRYKLPEESERIIEALENTPLRFHGSRTELEYKLRPPLVKSEDSKELFLKVREIGENLGLDLDEASVAGGSDGNFCSYYCPVIDGLGAVGAGAHSENEYIVVDKIPERTALLYLALKDINWP